MIRERPVQVPLNNTNEFQDLIRVISVAQTNILGLSECEHRIQSGLLLT